MSFSARMQAVNNRLINKFSERVQGDFYLIRKGTSHFDAAIGETVFNPATTIPITGLSIGFSANLVNGTTIQDGDVLIKMTNEVEPNMSDKVFMDNATWSIVALPHILYTGADKPISYQMQLRR
jgi:hypothetical protein